jgi:hypothetical protein
MGEWSRRAWLSARCDARVLWRCAYADVGAWPCWSLRIRAASLDGPLALGACVRVRLRCGAPTLLRGVEFDDGRLFTDELRLPGARLGHRHVVETTGPGRARLIDTVYLDGPLSWLWVALVGRRAARALPGGQHAAVAIANGLRLPAVEDVTPPATSRGAAPPGDRQHP